MRYHTVWIYLGLKIEWRNWYDHRRRDRETSWLLSHVGDNKSRLNSKFPKREECHHPMLKILYNYSLHFFSLYCPGNVSSHILYLVLIFISFHQDCTFESPLSPVSLVTTFTFSVLSSLACCNSFVLLIRELSSP